MLAKRGGIGRGPTDVNPNIAPVDPSQLLQRLQQDPDAGLMLRTVCGAGDKHADGPQLFRLLRSCGAGPCDRGAAPPPQKNPPPLFPPPPRARALLLLRR